MMMLNKPFFQAFPKPVQLLQALLLLIAVALLGVSLPLQAQVVVGEHVDAELIAETETFTPGQELWVALRLEHMENWHTYWVNPGDAGKPTEIHWNLPVGVSAGEIVWPTPERFELPAELVDFGYTEEIFLLIPFSIEESFSADALELSANVIWLECEDICIPGGADVSLSVPAGTVNDVAEFNEEWAYGFAQTRAALPREDIELDSMFSIIDGKINLLVQATEGIFENARDITFISDEHRILDYNAEQEITTQLSSLQLSQSHHRRVGREAPQRVGGLLLITDDDGVQLAYQVEAEPSGVSLSALGGVLPALGNNGAGGSNSDLSLATVFLFALLGGIILNLMPCVFPVLSLKVMSLAASSDSSIKEQRLHGVAYTAGVILAFLALASVLLALQAGGAAIGWGFHLQSPWFVGALIYLFFVMGLSMSGVVEFGTSIMGVGGELQEKEGYSGSFFTGVLASVVASPCTAPFMGAALGYAFTQTAAIALTVFFALGFGMALPFLILSFVPALAKMMPRPGKWMLTFKQLLAFPLYATVVWLLWVLGRETSIDAMALVVGCCVLLAFATWLYQRRREVSTVWRYTNAVIIVLCLLASISVLRSPLLETRTQSAGELAASENYEVYSDALLAQLRESNTPVFVNMTAAWCITCLVNEKVALDSDTFLAAMSDKNVTYLKGDWTNNDPEITAVLKRYQTSGVPLYLMFPADSSLPAEVLPQILTEGIMLDALNRI